MMFPEIAQDLSTLTDAELSALLDEILAFSAATQEAAGGKFSAEQAADLNRAADGADSIRAELAARETAAAERDASAAAALARLNPPTPTAEPAVEDTAEATPEPVAVAAAAKPATAPAVPKRAPVAVPPLASIAASVSAPSAITAAVHPPTTITAGADIPGIHAGDSLGTPSDGGFERIADALLKRTDAFRGSSQSGSEFVTVASLHSNMPDDRKLVAGSENANMALINAVTAPTAIKAAGGLCAPVTPYYDIMVLASTDRPVRDALPIFDASRGGIRLIPPPSFSAVGGQARVVTDGTTTNTSNVIGSVTANFNANDVGATVTGTGIPASTIITSVTPASNQATISNNATATGASISFTITRPGSVVWIPDTVDAAMLNGTAAQVAAGIKPCLHVTCPAVTEVHVGSIPACLEFGNLTARAYPEQVSAWMKLLLAWQARVADGQLLTTIGTGSTQVTAAQILGAASEIPAVIGKAAAYYRNHNRMSPETPLRLMLPQWVLRAGATDLILGPKYELELYTMAQASFQQAFEQFNINVTWYWDSGTGQGQLMNAGAAQGAGALTAYPTTAVGYLFSEGSWIFVDGGTLDLGVVRDSTLNASNNYRLFLESFESVVFVGLESLAITMTVAVNGSYAPAGTAVTGF